MKPKPLKRHKALQPLSREHHHGLLLCWKIRTGLKKNVAIERIKAYSEWFYTNHLIPHFKMEEAEIFTILDTNNTLIKKALVDHNKLNALFLGAYTKDTLQAIADKLEQHIRFEERSLFPEIQKKATTTQLEHIEHTHQTTPFTDNLCDEFWTL